MMFSPLWLVTLAGSTGCGVGASGRSAPTGSREPVRTGPSAAPLGVTPDGVGLRVGAPAPSVQLVDARGQAFDLGAHTASGRHLVVFYRGGWCPHCNLQIRALAQASAAFAARGVQPVLISVDRVEASAETQATWTIPYPVLADPDLAAHEAYRVVHQATPHEVERLRERGFELEAASGRTHHRFAIPSVFVIDAGVVRWAHVDPDHTRRPDVAALLGVLDVL